MKVLTLILLLLSSHIFAQNSDIFRVDSLPTDGVLLDKNWKFHAGDNPEWAKGTFDDAAWASIDPTKDIMEVPQIQDGKIGWLRLQLKMDSSLLSKPCFLGVFQTIASEIYVDGQLIKRFGELHPTESKANYTGYPTMFTPVNLPKSQTNITIAVRFAMQKGLTYNRFANGANCLFHSTIISIDNITELDYSLKEQIMFCFSKVGAFMILFIIHIAFFVFYPPQNANLYFSGMALFFAIFNTMWGSFLVFFPIENLKFLMFIGLIRVPIYTIAYILLVRAFYAMYNFKIDVIFWLIFWVNVLILLANYFDYFSGVQVSEFRTITLSILASLYITIKAMLAKKRNAQLVFIGLLCSIAALTARFLIDYYGFMSEYRFSILTHAFDFIGQISIPISISWFLGNDFAYTSKVLAKKLEEVQQLSEEKQLILATQNETLEKQVQERTAELKASQNQLIQSEKLASLGELTSGIAHLIQNPLNFVNNFSELNVDLAEDLKVEIQKPDIDKVYVEELLIDLRQNQEKINNHGKQASNIVKGMLEHARTTKGAKELTDINALIDKYFFISYHSLKGKDKDVNINMKTDLDKNLPTIEVFPQDLGRVLLNILNNAFYAVNQRSQQLAPSYTPSVFVTTQLVDNQIVIKIKDNGLGMSESMRTKVFQPFFTTKPNGEGTGLGLSLAYDIVTKGHGGTLEVDSTEGVGTEFIIRLPYTL
jgi:two-component system, NtrC family, sensor kinase